MREILKVTIPSVLLLLACGPAQPKLNQETVDSAPAPDALMLPDAEPQVEAIIYAHSSSQLFELDPMTLNVTSIGSFGIGSVTDIAVNRDGDIWGVTFSQVLQIDATTGAATVLSPLSGYFNGLSFLPDPSDPDKEILVAVSQDGIVYEVDPNTGTSTQIGEYDGYTSVGDLFYAKGLGTYAIARDGSGSKLVTLDQSNNYKATEVGPISQSGIYGVGFWADTIYGFSSSGPIVAIDPQNGATSLISDTAIGWWGAGVTTQATVVVQ